MKYCTRCGSEISENAKFCANCGCQIVYTTSATQSTTQNSTVRSSSDNVLGTITKVFLVLSLVALVFVTITMFFVAGILSSGLIPDNEFTELTSSFFIYIAQAFLLPFAWVLPMTIHIWKRLNSGEPISMAMKICTLLFINVIPGILLLCMSDN